MKLSLTAQGLILVCIPLCFEVVCVFTLYNLQQEAEAQAARAMKARQISDCINRLTNEFYQTWNTVTITTKPNWLQKGYTNNAYKTALGGLRKRYAELRELTADQPQFQKEINQSCHALDQAELLLSTAVAKINEGKIEEVLKMRDEKMDELRDLFKQCISRELLISAQHEQDVLNSSPQQQSSLRKQIVNYAILTVLFSVIFSILMAIFVVKRITSRIGIMNDNARRLASSQPLHPVLQGSDEIVELDQVFHKMADDIEETARMRQELVSMLTHDLRSPLTSIQGCLEMLDAGMLGELNERGTKLVHLADRNSGRMMSLINDLLDIQKIKSGMMNIEIGEVEMAQLFEEVKLNVADWVKEHDIALVVGPSDYRVKGNAEKLTRVIFNLVSNAVKYSPRGGTITLTAEPVDNFVRVSVRDEGGGIPLEMQKSIFEKFQQANTEADKGKGGSGLGLAICQAIIGLHGGKIWVESEPGKGSAFYFTVPSMAPS